MHYQERLNIYPKLVESIPNIVPERSSSDETVFARRLVHSHPRPRRFASIDWGLLYVRLEQLSLPPRGTEQFGLEAIPVN